MDFKTCNPPTVGMHPTFGHPVSHTLARYQGGRGLGAFFARLFPQFRRLVSARLLPAAKAALAKPAVRAAGKKVKSAAKKSALAAAQALLDGEQPKQALKRSADQLKGHLSSSLAKYQKRRKSVSESSGSDSDDDDDDDDDGVTGVVGSGQDNSKDGDNTKPLSKRGQKGGGVNTESTEGATLEDATSEDDTPEAPSVGSGSKAMPVDPTSKKKKKARADSASLFKFIR